MFGYNPSDDQHFLYNLYGAKYSVNGYYGKYHTGIDMYGVPGTAENGEDKLTIHSAHATTEYLLSGLTMMLSLLFCNKKGSIRSMRNESFMHCWILMKAAACPGVKIKYRAK